MSRLHPSQKIQTHWWSKTLTGAVLGFTLAIALVGLFAWFGPGGITANSKVQFNMWLIAPIWMLTLSLVYLFRTGLRAFLWLLVANLATYTLLLSLR